MITWTDAASGQEPSHPLSGPVSVAAALIDTDGNFQPDQLGKTITVQGILTSDPLVTGRNAALVNLQDTSGGLLLFTRVPSRLENRFKAGDEVRASGVLEHYQGTDQLNVKEVEFIREAGVPSPRVVTAAEINSEAFAGQLVRLRGRIRLLEKPDADGAQAEITDASGRAHVFIPSRFYAEPDFLGDLPDLHEAEVIGVVGQKDLTPPLDSGYRLIPRTTADFTFFAAPPYGLMLVAGSVTLLVIASLILWRSRREAYRVNREMRTLTESLQHSEVKLREHQARLGLMTEQVPAIMWSADRNLRFTSSIGAGLKSLNLEQDEVVGMTLFEYFKTDDIKMPEIAVHRQAIAGISASFEARWGGRDYDCNIVPLKNERGEIVGAVGLALDTTDRSRAEKALKDQSEVLRQAQKMEAVGRLAGGVAHDFNNLVTVIKGYCDLIALKLGPGHDVQDWFDEIKNSANRAASLTGQLLAFSRKQVLEPRVIDLNEVFSDMNRLLRRIIGEHIDLVTSLAPAMGHVRVDKGQLEQVIMNLAVNAYDAMPKGGRLSIETTSCTLTGAEPGSAGHLPPGDYAQILFSDTGEGMTPEVMSRVFEPFFTTKEVGRGTGLGLATVYGIVTQSGGTIEVESVPGEGTTFRVYLPIATELPTRTPIVLSSGRNTRGSETVLLAEDEESVRSLIRRTLEDKGYHVLEAANGQEALQLSHDFAGPIALLLTDVVMPRMSGFKLAQAIRESRPETKILYVSGYAYTGRHEGETIAPENFLAKPFSPETLAIRVRRLLMEPVVQTP